MSLRNFVQEQKLVSASIGVLTTIPGNGLAKVLGLQIDSSAVNDAVPGRCLRARYPSFHISHSLCCRKAGKFRCLPCKCQIACCESSVPLRIQESFSLSFLCIRIANTWGCRQGEETHEIQLKPNAGSRRH